MKYYVNYTRDAILSVLATSLEDSKVRILGKVKSKTITLDQELLRLPEYTSSLRF
jgi:hypothetical protein